MQNLIIVARVLFSCSQMKLELLPSEKIVSRKLHACEFSLWVQMQVLMLLSLTTALRGPNLAESLGNNCMLYNYPRKA